ncbi:MAG: citrate/2-methylcitrate synthase [Sporolactobacillus sp.]
MVRVRGLEGVVATTSAISSIQHDRLTYRGYSIQDLAKQATFEEVIYLLWHGELPSGPQLAALKAELTENANVPEAIFSMMRTLPFAHVHPMAVLRTAVSALGQFDEQADVVDAGGGKQKALHIQAKIATLVAGLARIRNGLSPLAPERTLSYAANFLYMLSGSKPSAIEAETFDAALILHADHELNASTFTARVCVATLSDMYSGVTAAIGALKGPLHGGANEQVMRMLEQLHSQEEATAYIDHALTCKQKIMGFGHRVYKNGDPRAQILKRMAEQLTCGTAYERLYQLSAHIEQLIGARKGLLPNTDFYSATIYHALGIETDLFTPVFAISRTAGWTAHILEQYSDNRLIRPRAEYDGKALRPYIPLRDRQAPQHQQADL